MRTEQQTFLTTAEFKGEVGPVDLVEALVIYC